MKEKRKEVKRYLEKHIDHQSSVVEKKVEIKEQKRKKESGDIPAPWKQRKGLWLLLGEDIYHK